jgi:hypothetical protein
MAGAVTWDRAILKRFKTILEDYLQAELTAQTADVSWSLSTPDEDHIILARVFTPPDRTNQIQIFVKKSKDEEKQFLNKDAPKKRIVEVTVRAWVTDPNPEVVEVKRATMASAIAEVIGDKWTADGNPAKLTEVKVGIDHSDSSEHFRDEVRGPMGDAFGQGASQNTNITFIDISFSCKQRVKQSVSL